MKSSCALIKYHINFDSKSKFKFQFVFVFWFLLQTHTQGVIDLPAMIDYVLNATNQSSLFYAGHSQGTTAFFVMCSERPEYNTKIKVMHALAPVVFMSNAKSPVLRITDLIPSTLLVSTSFIAIVFLSLYLHISQSILCLFARMNLWCFLCFLSSIFMLQRVSDTLLGAFEFMPSSELLALIGQNLCRATTPIVALCKSVLFLACGFNAKNLNSVSRIFLKSKYSLFGVRSKHLKLSFLWLFFVRQWFLSIWLTRQPVHLLNKFFTMRRSINRGGSVNTTMDYKISESTAVQVHRLIIWATLKPVLFFIIQIMIGSVHRSMLIGCLSNCRTLN